MTTYRGTRDSLRPSADKLFLDVAEYVLEREPGSAEARSTATHCLLDTLGCGILALNYPACQKLLGPVVPNAELTGGARVPGTAFELDPITAAFNIGAMIRWLDFNDTWLAAEWGHPSDNLGGILAVADYLDRQEKKPTLTIGDVLTAMIQAHEIQGVLALNHAFNRVGLDHVLLVRIATTAVATRMLGGTREQIIDAISNAWVDGGALRTYRHAPNTGSRKSWAAGDATSRGVRLALLTLRGEMGYPSALSAQTWGFQDVLFGSTPIELERTLSSYVMENILFKLSFPAEFHAQTAVEAAMTLHPKVSKRLDAIAEIEIETQEAGVRIIDKSGPLANPADRDHCIQYMVSVALIFGRLTADDYEEDVAQDPRIDELRKKMVVRENQQFSTDYLDPEKRAIGNAITIRFEDGTSTDRIAVDYPIGHRRRRAEGIPVLREKFERNLRSFYSDNQANTILAACSDLPGLENMSVSSFMDLWITTE